MAAGPADDAEVIARSRHSPEHFADLFHRHAPALKRDAVRRLGAAAAEDVVAETFVAACQQRATYDLTRDDARARPARGRPRRAAGRALGDIDPTAVTEELAS
ncbi:DNA-directed RNA polymerase specialized sigma24 family protein [Nonomuraea muscovyensis]|uniref:DNA-directed RNA polymerase specialized sigma24 family protein n=1 Tax=Nonomuraea muscovyensis TaxID=1124761 RepID=A0A7X0BZU8_9ACTN|nr:sigma factor [Nonomuraea muscovyensis]MBB6345817.1 DNA-directed RNA polymerase specialized sigma24 family protein [Nonomuraea muscovyensis]